MLRAGLIIRPARFSYMFKVFLTTFISLANKARRTKKKVFIKRLSSELFAAMSIVLCSSKDRAINNNQNISLPKKEEVTTKL